VIRPKTVLEHPYRVRFDEAGADGALRSSGYLRWAQDMAWRHSDSAGLGREWYGEHQLTWLIRAVELDIVQAASYGSEVVVSTEVLGFRRVLARRRSQFHSREGGRLLATALIDWVLVNASGRPTRVPAPIQDLLPAGEAFTPLRVELPGPPGDASSRDMGARHGEIDPMGHVNNAAYLDYVDEQLIRAGHEATVRRLPRRYRAEFARPAERGMSLRAQAWRDGDDWCFRLSDDGPRDLFRARLEVAQAEWVGG